MATGDLGTLQMPGFTIGAAEAFGRGVWSPLTVDAGSLAGRAIKIVNVPGGTLALAETTNAGYFGFVTMSVADSAGKAWKTLAIGHITLTLVATTIANVWALLTINVADASAANTRKFPIDGGTLTLVETGTQGKRALLLMPSSAVGTTTQTALTIGGVTIASAGGGLLAGGSILPLTIDFTALSDGAIPTTLSGATFSIVSGRLVNAPSVGAELLTDPGLEATYTAGKCDTLTLNGSPTLAQSADVHGGTKAQEFTAAAFNNRLNFPLVASVAGAWYRFSEWVKRTAGTGTDTRFRVDHATMTPQAGSGAGATINVASYTQKQASFLTRTAANITPFAIIEQGSSAFDTVIADDASLKRLTYADLFALMTSATQANVIAKVRPNTIADHTLSALVARADAASSPASCLFAFWRWRDPEDLIVVSMVELSAGTYTVKVAEASLSIVVDAWLELRASGTTVSMWYNNVQVGTDQTVTPNGTYHGALITGGNSIKSFFLQAN